MKKNYVFLILGAALLSMNACKSELDLDKELKFSKLSVEKQKEKIENNGIEFVNAMEGIQDTKAMTTMTYMINFSTLESNESGYVDVEVLKAPLRKFSNDIKKARKNAFSNFDRQMRSSFIDSEVWGEYSYNFETEKLEKTKTLTNKIIARFPASAASTKNNAEIIITYEESKVKIPESEDFYPSTITFKMSVDSKEVMSADFSGAYYNDGSPKKATQSLKIEDYKWTAEIENDQKTASESYEFKKGSKTMIKSVAEVNGTLTKEALSDAIELDKPQNAIKSFAVFFQVMDVAVKGGTTEFKAFAEAIIKIQDNKKLSEKEVMEQTATLINQYMVCTAFFADDNKKFADIEFYVVEEVDTYNYYDPWTQKEVTETNYYYTFAPRFVLSDGSKVDAEEYARTGFEDLIKKIEDMVGDL